MRLILAEGNYLLLKRDPWPSLRAHFDATVMIDVPEAELKRRLRGRWIDHGLTPPEIDTKLEDNDLPNGRVVTGESMAPDYLLQGGTGQLDPHLWRDQSQRRNAMT